MQVQAKAKFIRMSPKKIRLVANLIKGLDVTKALDSLQFIKRDAKNPLDKLLKSAIANAEENLNLEKGNLFIKEIRVDGGPTLKRWMPRAFGRATPLRKRSSHISLILDERVPTIAPVSVKKKDNKDDLVKVGDTREIKALDKGNKEGKSDIKLDKKVKSGKGFAGKVFNRRSGDK